jgi:hypothetical protein
VRAGLCISSLLLQPHVPLRDSLRPTVAETISPSSSCSYLALTPLWGTTNDSVNSSESWIDHSTLSSLASSPSLTFYLSTLDSRSTLHYRPSRLTLHKVLKSLAVWPALPIARRIPFLSRSLLGLPFTLHFAMLPCPTYRLYTAQLYQISYGGNRMKARRVRLAILSSHWRGWGMQYSTLLRPKHA